MPPYAVGLLLAGAGLATFGAKLRIAFAVYVGALFLVPAGARVPFVSHPYLSFHRIILIMLLLNLIRRLSTGEVPREVLRPSRLHAALFLWLGISFLIGVGLANPELRPSSTFYLWQSIAEQAVLFAVVVAIMRDTDDLRWMATLLVGVFLATTTIAVAEHFTRWSYAQWFFRSANRLFVPTGEAPLQTRGGDVRVRSAVQFSLAYAWIAVMLLPLSVAVATRTRRIVALLAPIAIAATILWTYTRSAYVGVALSALALVVASGFEVRITRVVLAGAAVAGLAVAGSGAVGRTFEAEGPDSIDVRFLRTPVALEQAAEEPYLGTGLSGLSSLGITSTDASFLLVYAEMGVIGVTAFGLLLVTILVVVWPAQRAPPGTSRALGAAVFVGLTAAIGAAASFDAFQVLPAYSTVWILAALGTALAERAAPGPGKERVGTARPARFRAARLARPVVAAGAGVGIGFVLLGAAPRADAITLAITTLRPSLEIHAEEAPEVFARLLLNSTCQIVNTIDERLPDTSVECLDLRTRLGIGQLRVVVPRSSSMDARLRLLIAKAHSVVPTLRPFVLGIERGFRPTWARTAPVWMGMATGGLALLFTSGPGPPRGTERRFRRARRVGSLMGASERA